MNELKVRNAVEKDVAAIMDVYDTARCFMRANGNMNQWINGYPSECDVRDDIKKGQSFVIEDDEGIVAVFALIFGEDPTYKIIENGSWLNDLPYGTVHRIGGNGRQHGIMKKCLEFVLEKSDNVRIDTHADNKPMQHVLEKLGFSRCGIIHIADGSPRVAFQFVK